MGIFKRRAEAVKPPAPQIRSESRHPFTALGGYVPMQSGETALYRAIREAVPIVDAALYKIIRLTGGVQVRCENEAVGAALNVFLRTVNTGRGQRGIGSFSTATSTTFSPAQGGGGDRSGRQAGT
jgi:hypothetical protein